MNLQQIKDKPQGWFPRNLIAAAKAKLGMINNMIKLTPEAKAVLIV